jgi:hypothetical protein
MPIFREGGGPTRRRRPGGAAVLAAILAIAGGVATAAATPVTTFGTPGQDPGRSALPGLEDAAPLKAVGGCAGFAGHPACLEPALPGSGERIVLAAAPAAKAALSNDGSIWGGKRSGLPWASGASSAGAEFEAWRGRKLDVKTGFLASRQGWKELTNTSHIRALVATGALPVLGVGLVPESARGQLGPCAAGAFDAHIRKVGQSLVAMGAARAVLRLGWEANRMGDFPWGVLGDGSTYKAQ